MPGLLIWIAGGIALAVLLGLIALWATGRYAKHKRGKPAFVLPVAGDSGLDTLLEPVQRAHPGQSGARLEPGESEALALRLALAQLAERSLDLMYYIWDDDLTGRLMAQAVLEAADRGVRVRMLLDDVNALNRDPVYRALDRHPRIEVRLFNPIRNRDRGFLRGLEILLNLLPYNRRMHGKMLIADHRLGVTGGRNIGDAYFGVLDDRGVNYDDLDILLAGAVLHDLGGLYDSFWNSALALPIRTLWLGKTSRLRRFRARLAHRLSEALSQRRAGALALPVVDDAVSVLRLDALRWSNDLSFVGDPPQKTLGGARDGWMPGALLPVLQSAQHSLRVMTPYFVPGTEGMAALVALQRRGVQIEVITNSLALADNVLVHGAYRWYRARLLAEGVRIVEVSATNSPRKMLHSKAFLVDDARGFVGSFNFDMRSAFLNTELGAVFEEPHLVADLQAIFDAACAPDRAWRVTLRGRWPFWSRGSGGTAREPDSTAARRMVSFVVGHLPIHRFL